MRILIGLLALLAGLSAPRSDAAIITYEFGGVLSGTLGDRPFSDAPVIFTLTGDTAGITSSGGVPGSVPFNQFFATAPASLAFVIDGVRGTFIEPFRVFARTFAPFGLPGRAIGTIGLTPADTSNDLLDVRDFPLAQYNLATPFAPFTQTSPDFLNTGEAYLTSAGDLILEEGQADSLTFQAFAATPVPEPSGFVLMGVALLVAAAWSRRV